MFWYIDIGMDGYVAIIGVASCKLMIDGYRRPSMYRSAQSAQCIKILIGTRSSLLM